MSGEPITQVYRPRMAIVCAHTLTPVNTDSMTVFFVAGLRNPP
jgi:hypothetical protein